MKQSRIIQTVFLYAVFVFYLLFLGKLLLFSRISLTELFSGEQSAQRSYNLIPFRSIMHFISGDTENATRFAFSNVIGNIIAFLPLGAYLMFFEKSKKMRRPLLLVLIVSIFVELLQGALALGTADIDDVILNCVGGCLGIWGYKLIGAITRDEKKTRIIMTILSGLGLPVLLYLMFFIQLRL